MATERYTIKYEQLKAKKNVYKIYVSATCVTKER